MRDPRADPRVERDRRRFLDARAHVALEQRGELRVAGAHERQDEHELRPVAEDARVELERLQQLGLDFARALQPHRRQPRDLPLRGDRALLGAEAAKQRDLIGADGAHSTVRRAPGIDFQGSSYVGRFDVADEEPESDLFPDALVIALHPDDGTAMFFPMRGEPPVARDVRRTTDRASTPMPEAAPSSARPGPPARLARVCCSAPAERNMSNTPRRDAGSIARGWADGAGQRPEGS